MLSFISAVETTVSSPIHVHCGDSHRDGVLGDEKGISGGTAWQTKVWGTASSSNFLPAFAAVSTTNCKSNAQSRQHDQRHPTTDYRVVHLVQSTWLLIIVTVAHDILLNGSRLM